MEIAGWQKCTLIDFPERIATIVFTQGCNFRCPFCHNGQLLPTGGRGIGEGEIFRFLARNKKKLTGVVISGGEPTLQADLGQFFGEIRSLGLATKLDTNGSRPEILAQLLRDGLLDFVAMDLKNIPSDYDRTCGTRAPLGAIAHSLEILRASGIDYELRTTVVPTLHDLARLPELVELIRGAPRFTLQDFRPKSATDPELRKVQPYGPEKLETLRPFFEPFVKKFTVR
jgi:pyruvate formate lyase activating enzyme